MVPANDVLGAASTVIATSSVSSVHTPLLTVQRNVVLAPAVKPLTELVLLDGLSAVPVPDTVLQEPVPVLGFVADKFTAVPSQTVWLAPAEAVLGAASTVIVTSSVSSGHTPLLMVHLNVVLAPAVNPLTELVLLDGLSAVPVPDTVLQEPVPVVGLFADRFTASPSHTVWLVPADAVLGASSIVTLTADETETHVPGSLGSVISTV